MSPTNRGGSPPQSRKAPSPPDADDRPPPERGRTPGRHRRKPGASTMFRVSAGSQTGGDRGQAFDGRLTVKTARASRAPRTASTAGAGTRRGADATRARAPRSMTPPRAGGKEETAARPAADRSGRPPLGRQGLFYLRRVVAGTPERPGPTAPRPSEPILVPKLRIQFADFPYLH